MQNAPQPAAAAPGKALAWRTFRLTSVAAFLVALDATALVAAYAALRAEFGSVSPAWLSWTLNAYTIVYAALLVPAGRLADLRGRKRVFLWGLTLFTLASVLCALAPGVGALVAARTLQAVGAALLTPASLGLVLSAFPPDRRAAAVGLFSAVGALAAAFGPAFGSWIIEQGSWRWIFLANAPVGVAAWLLGRRRLPESTSPESGARLDLPGVVLLALGAAGVTWGIVLSGESGWAAGTPWAALAAGLALLLVFARWAQGRPAAALDLSLFRDRSYLFVNLASLAFGVAFTMMFLSAFLFLMGVWGYSQTLAGVAVTPGPLVAIPAAIAAARLSVRFGHRPLLLAGGVLYALAQAWLGWRAGPAADYLGVWLPAQLVGGIAVGLILPSLSGAAVARLPATRFAVGAAVNNALRQLGGAVGAALTIALVGRVGADLAQFQAVFALLAAFGLLTALLSLPVDTHAAPRPAAAAQAAQT
jgi:EmrB/QacA subfamily drug resistance transporter